MPAIEYPLETNYLKVVDGFVIEPTNVTPLIQYNPNSNLLEFRGKSSPENAPAFYDQVQLWFKRDSFQTLQSLTVEMCLNYFNTSSCKCLFMIFKKLNQFRQRGMQITVNWRYEEDDDDMLEAGVDFSEIFDLNFNMIEEENLN